MILGIAGLLDTRLVRLLPVPILLRPTGSAASWRLGGLAGFSPRALRTSSFAAMNPIDPPLGIVCRDRDRTCARVLGVNRGRLLLVVAAPVVIVAMVVGIGQAPESERPGIGPGAKQIEATRDRAPAALRALYAHGDELRHLHGDEFVAAIRRLRGYPIVINKWASWCGPCRREFPMLRRLSARYGDRVAFLGLNAGDARRSARAFLRSHPTLYPHVIDPAEQISRALRAGGVFPSTIFMDRDGDIVTVRPGPFATQAELEQAIRRFALAANPVRPPPAG